MYSDNYYNCDLFEDGTAALRRVISLKLISRLKTACVL